MSIDYLSTNENSSSNTWIFIVVGLVICIVIGLVLYFYVYKKTTTDSITPTTSPTTSPTRSPTTSPTPTPTPSPSPTIYKWMPLEDGMCSTADKTIRINNQTLNIPKYTKKYICIDSNVNIPTDYYARQQFINNSVNTDGDNLTCPNTPTQEDINKWVKCPVDCQVSGWSVWNNECLPPNKTRNRTRTIIQPALNGGRECPVLTEEEKCPEIINPPLPVDNNTYVKVIKMKPVSDSIEEWSYPEVKFKDESKVLSNDESKSYTVFIYFNNIKVGNKDIISDPKYTQNDNLVAAGGTPMLTSFPKIKPINGYLHFLLPPLFPQSDGVYTFKVSSADFRETKIGELQYTKSTNQFSNV